jgi:hypothetical protein
MAHKFVLPAFKNFISFLIVSSKSASVLKGSSNTMWLICYQNASRIVEMESYLQFSKNAMTKIESVETDAILHAKWNLDSCARSSNPVNALYTLILKWPLSITYLVFWAKTQESSLSRSIRRTQDCRKCPGIN